jgi:SWI/SNF-related matrix-associated actin-dependent regulator 1 of chromatin subfamily A
MVSGRLSLADDHLVVDFPYDKDQVDEIKRIDGSKWDKVGRVWRVPMSSLPEARQFAAKHGFKVDTDVLKFDVPEHDIPATGVTWEEPWIYLSFKWDPVKVRSVKTLPGVTWHAPAKAWRVPETAIKQAIEWADRFNEPVSDVMRAQANDVERHREQLISDSRATDAEVQIPNLQGELLPYQRAGVRYAAQARRTFIADDMGLGKTLQSIATLELANKDAPAYPAVVVCPPSLVLNWRNEYAKWLPTRSVAVVTNRKEFPEKGYDVVVVGWSNVHTWSRELSKHKSYVFDESHYAKTPTAQRAKAAKKIARSAPKDGVVLCLTGTPITNRPAEYAAQLDILGKLDKFGGLWGFYRRYCAAFRDKWGQWHLEGASNLDELNDRLRGECYIRRTKEQVLKELPPVRHSELVVTGSVTGMKEYRKAEADIVKYVTERARQIAEELGVSPGAAAVRAKMAAEANQHLVRIGVLRKLAAMAKMAAVTEFIDSHVSEGKKVVVAAHHREVVDELANRYGNLKIQGGMDVELVEEYKELFQTGDVEDAPVMVLSIQAAKTGHTLTAAQDVLFVELPWTPADVDQTYSRCHRLGQKGSVNVTYMLCEGTIDQEIHAIINEKRDVVNAAVEGGTTIGKDGVERLLSLFMSV